MKSRCKYSGLSIPIDLVNEIKKEIKNSYKYHSITDYVKWAIIEKLERKP